MEEAVVRYLKLRMLVDKPIMSIYVIASYVPAQIARETLGRSCVTLALDSTMAVRYTCHCNSRGRENFDWESWRRFVD